MARIIVNTDRSAVNDVRCNKLSFPNDMSPHTDAHFVNSNAIILQTRKLTEKVISACEYKSAD